MSAQSISVRWRSAGASAASPPRRHSSVWKTSGSSTLSCIWRSIEVASTATVIDVGRELRPGCGPGVLADVGDAELDVRFAARSESQLPSASQKGSSARAMRRRSSVVNFVGWEKSSARMPRPASSESPGRRPRSWRGAPLSADSLAFMLAQPSPAGDPSASAASAGSGSAVGPTAGCPAPPVLAAEHRPRVVLGELRILLAIEYLGDAQTVLLVHDDHLAAGDRGAVHEQVGGLTGQALERHHRAGAQIERLPDGHVRAADLHAQLHRDVAQAAEVHLGDRAVAWLRGLVELLVLDCLGHDLLPIGR